MKDKYGDEAVAEGDYSDSSESSEDDEDPKALLNDAEWLKTLALIKSKDSRIYDPNFSFYKKKEGQEGDKKDEEEGEKGKKKQKPLYLRDYERKMIVEAEGFVVFFCFSCMFKFGSLFSGNLLMKKMMKV